MAQEIDIVSRSGFVISAFEGEGMHRVSTRSYAVRDAGEICKYLESIGYAASWARDNEKTDRAWIYAEDMSR